MTNTIENSREDKQQLYETLISEEYSKIKEITLPKPKDDDWQTPNWFESFIEWLFDNNTDWYILSALLKGLAILALILLIYWIVKNSDSIIGWVKKRSWKGGSRIVEIEDYRQAHLAQGWENLPPHEQIPSVVKQLLQEGNILPASSILYRGSLRWTNESNPQTTLIRPANTELQCVELIKQLRQSYQSNTVASISAPTADYIIDIINQWIPIAYKTDDKESDQQQYKQEQAEYQQALSSFVNDWQSQLPPPNISPKRTSSPSQNLVNGSKEYE